MTVLSQMTYEGTGGETIQTTNEDGTEPLTIPSTSLLTMGQNNGTDMVQQQQPQVITIDAAQFELFQQQQQLRQMNDDDSNVTYYVYDNGDAVAAGVGDDSEKEMLRNSIQ